MKREIESRFWTRNTHRDRSSSWLKRRDGQFSLRMRRWKIHPLVVNTNRAIKIQRGHWYRGRNSSNESMTIFKHTYSQLFSFKATFRKVRKKNGKMFRWFEREIYTKEEVFEDESYQQKCKRFRLQIKRLRVQILMIHFRFLFDFSVLNSKKSAPP